MATIAASTERSNRFWDRYDELVRLAKKKIAAIDLFDETFADRTASNPWYALGSMVYTFWIMVIVTGLLLIMYYIPNTSRAYDSILHIQEGVRLGWLIRGVHKYGADAIIIAATMRVYRMYFTGEYKQRELAWVIAFLTLLVGMFSGLTGYLLMWNQRAFWASKVFATFPTYLDQIPFVGLTHFGMTQAQFLLGGTAIGEATLTRFYAGHFALSMVCLIPVEAYFLRKGLRRIHLSWGGIAILFAMLASVAAFVPVELGSRANRAETPLPILSDWYFLGLYQMMKEMKPLYAVLGTIFIPIITLAMPLLDRAKDVPTWRRPFFFCFGLTGLIHWLVLSFMIIMDYAQITTDPPKIWGSFALVCLASGCFEFRAMGYPRPRLMRRVGVLVALWIGLFVVFGAWTRFRMPGYAGSYFPPGVCKVLVLADSTERDRLNGRFRGADEDSWVDDAVNALRSPVVTEWYTADEEQAARLVAAQASVRGWWVAMTMIMLLCAVLAVAFTPPEGIESAIYPSRTAAGRAIKGLPEPETT